MTVNTPSTNFVLKRTLALLNIPSLRDNNELGVSKVRAQHLPNVLGVGEIKSSVDFVKKVDRSRFEEKQREDEKERYQ